MQVVILAGGLGTRLRPLTEKFPKPMAPIKGKPFLEYQLTLLKKNNLNNVILCVGYLGEKIKDYFGNGEKMGMDIIYSKEDRPLGTGGALKNAQHLLEKEFILLYGDSFLDIDYQDVVKKFRALKKDGMSVIFENNPKIAHNNIEARENFEIVNYDKENEDKCNYIEAGVHVFKKSILHFIPENSVFSLEEDVFPCLIRRRELFAYPTGVRFYDIGTFERFENFKKIL